MKAKRKQSFVFFCVFISVLFLASAVDTFAQKGNVTVSVEGGLGFRSLRGNEIVNSNSKSDLGYIFGLSAQYGFSNNYSFKGGIYFQRKGAKSTFNSTDTSGNPVTSTTKTNLNYITLPILFKGTYGDNVKFFFNLGPFVGILLSSDIDFEEESEDIEEVVNNSDNDNTFDFGLTGGIGVIIPLNKKTGLSMEIRDDLGLVNISKSQILNNGTLNTNSLNFILGVTF